MFDRFEEPDVDQESIKQMLLEHEALSIGGQYTSLGNAVERRSQEIYEFCRELMRGKSPNLEVLRLNLEDALNNEAQDFYISVVE